MRRRDEDERFSIVDKWIREEVFSANKEIFYDHREIFSNTGEMVCDAGEIFSDTKGKGTVKKKPYSSRRKSFFEHRTLKISGDAYYNCLFILTWFSAFCSYQKMVRRLFLVSAFGTKIT